MVKVLDLDESNLRKFALSVGEKCKKVIEASPYVRASRTPVQIRITDTKADNSGRGSFSVQASFKADKQERKRDELLKSIKTALTGIESFISSKESLGAYRGRASRGGMLRNTSISIRPKVLSDSGSDIVVELMTVTLILDKERYDKMDSKETESWKASESLEALKSLATKFASLSRDEGLARYKNDLGRINPRLAAEVANFLKQSQVLASKLKALL